MSIGRLLSADRTAAAATATPFLFGHVRFKKRAIAALSCRMTGMRSKQGREAAAPTGRAFNSLILESLVIALYINLLDLTGWRKRLKEPGRALADFHAGPLPWKSALRGPQRWRRSA
jgi:hypothetical protein